MLQHHMQDAGGLAVDAQLSSCLELFRVSGVTSIMTVVTVLIYTLSQVNAEHWDLLVGNKLGGRVAQCAAGAQEEEEGLHTVCSSGCTATDTS
jgi:hypothetical protein